MNHLFQKLHMPADLAIEFVATFARMEHALKSAGYALGNEDKVEPAWDRFANKIHEQFDQLASEELIAAKDLLLNSPPRKQVLLNGQVIFQEQLLDQKQRTTQQIIRFVRTVRNNLFHGGKFLPIGEAESGRNEALVRSSLKIIKACIELNEEVKQSYEH
ncbi:hypothetical protein [Salinivibrio sp. IB574]|uniref:hypothetical protein n=1 Tax=Salinivibrio sp. IB574 TaxID=1909444 RepID=UPI0009899DEC|nr:hypothetical protein [Salinivibrio sp. IB574]